ncbi:MAG: hypothetical protein WAM39_13865 [Bryobacteraceae bacterium]
MDRKPGTRLNGFVGFLGSHGHNFTLLWITEMPRFCHLPITAGDPPDFVVTPLPWARTGPGEGWRLEIRSDQVRWGFFDRLRIRVEELRKAGIYAGVYLFTGEWLNVFRCSSDGYPFTGTNNINGVDDGYAGGKKGIGALTMTAPNEVTRFQDA